jgi:hypothetical protein
MSRRPSPLVLLVLLAALGTGAAGQSLVTEVLTVSHRPAAQLLETLRPLVPEPGSLSAFQNQLLVRTSPDNLKILREVLARLDRAPVNLMVSVRHTVNDDVRRDLAAARLSAGGRAGGQAGARVGGGGARVESGSDGVRASARIRSTRETARERDVQRVRVLEGYPAFIRTGRSVPVGRRDVVTTARRGVVVDSIEYEEVSRGFYVRPVLSADTVTLEIAPRRDRLDSGGAIERRGAETVVSVPLGRWTRIGGVSQSGDRKTSGLAAATTERRDRDYRLFIKVDRVD